MKTSSSILTRSLIDGAVKLGIDRNELLKRANVDPDLLIDPESRAPDGTHPRLMKEAIALSGDELIALRIGGLYQTDPSDHMSNLFFNSPNLRIALENVARLYHFLTDETYLKFQEEGDLIKLTLINSDLAMNYDRSMVEWTLSVWARFVRLFTGKELKFLTTNFKHSEKQFADRYADYFGGIIKFGQPENELFFSAKYLDVPNTMARPTVFEIAKRLTEEKLSQLESHETLIDLVKKELKEMLRGTPPDQTRIANKLGMTPRTLQRRLKTHGVTYRKLLEELRREYSLKLLTGKNTSISDIAFYLGYADKTNFYQEFSRWHGAPPGKFKKP